MTDVATGPARTTRAHMLAAVLLPAFVAAWLYWPTRHGGLLADELLLRTYVADPLTDGTDWQRVADDFAGPWAFLFGGYYRPLVTLSLAIDHQLGGGEPWMLHCSGIVFLAVGVAALAAMLGVLFGPLAAFAGGLLYAIHPACHEPVCWPCTRADTMVLVPFAIASIAFVRHLRGEPGRHLVVAGTASVFALLCKETGILLAPWFVLLDFALRNRATLLRERLRPHVRLLPVWLCYLAWRALVLDSPIAGAGGHPGAAPSEWIGLQVAKLQACFAPAGERLPALTPFVLGALTVWLVAGAIVWPPQRRWLVVAAVWFAASLLPVQWQETTADLARSRFVMMPLLALAILAAAVLGTRVCARWFRAAGFVLLVVAVPVLVAATRALEVEYERAWRQTAELRQQIAAAAAPATEDEPLVLMFSPSYYRDIVFLPPAMAWTLTEPPLLATEHPFIDLSLMVQHGQGADLLFWDVAVWRALWRHGARMCCWLDGDGDGDFSLVLVPQRDAEHATEFAPSPGGFRVRGAPVSPWPIAAVEVTAAAPFSGGVLAWRTTGREFDHHTIGASRDDGGRATAVVDLTGDLGFLTFGTLRGITGFDVHLTGATDVRATGVRVLSPPPDVPLASTLRGAVVATSELAARLPLATVPTNADPGSTSAVLMTKGLGFRVRLARGEPVVVPAVVQPWLTEFDRFAADSRVWYYLEWQEAGRTVRSRIDWFRRLRGR